MKATEQTRIAIFDSYGGIVPEGCPEEYYKQDFPSRKAFADWLLANGKGFLVDEHDGISVYEYMREGKNWRVQARAAVVPVDIGRPWLIHAYDGREKIWYLDNVGEYNMVTPDIQPELVTYGFTGDSCVVGK